MSDETYKQGDVIGGKYEVLKTLGQGGFGVVYLVRVRLRATAATGDVFVEEFALKTFLDKWMANPGVREAFKKEALVWVNLEAHPCILAAQCVDEVSGRLFVQMEYVAADDQGRVTLGDHLAKAKNPLPIKQTLTWAIQFCLGMEHAVAHGVKCHRDINPRNVLISREGVLKVSDFGLAVAAEKVLRDASGPFSATSASDEEGFSFGVVQPQKKSWCGTPGYVPPEVYCGEVADIRSDIYGFGLVLWQMAAGSSSQPFSASRRGDTEQYMRAVYEQQIAGRIPLVNGQVDAVIARCLRPKPSQRYNSFSELRVALERIYQEQVGGKFELPQRQERTDVFWNNQGMSLNALGRHSEAVASFDKALAIDLRNSFVLNNKGVALDALGQHGEAILCYEKALAIDPRVAQAWCNKGNALYILGRFEEADVALDKALALNPREPNAWNNKANALQALGRYSEAIICYDKLLAADPRDIKAWNNKGSALNALGAHDEGFACYEKALAIDPLDVNAWNGRGSAYKALGRTADALACYSKALELNPQRADVWCNKGNAFFAESRHAEALQCFDKAVALNPKDMKSWCNRGVALKALGRLGEAVASYDKALVLDPRDAKTWFNKGNAFAAQERYQDALVCFQQAQELGHPDAATSVEQCRRLLRTDEHYLGASATNTNEAQEWFSKAAALAESKKHADAVSCYETGLKLDPNNAAAWFNMGHSIGFLGRHNDVVKCCDRALEIHPNFSPLWILKGLGFVSMEHFRDAMDCFQRAEKLDDASAAGHMARCRMSHAEWYFRLGSGYQQEGNNAEAINCYEKGLALNPDGNAIIWSNKGVALLALKRNAEAVICFDRGIALRPEDWGAWNNKGIALYFMEQFAAALPVLEEAQRLGATRCASMIAVCRDKLGKR